LCLFQGELRNINAAVAGVLITALYKPLWTSTVRASLDFWFVVLAFALLTIGRVQPWLVVLAVSLTYLLVA
jgi:chromate transporter